MKYQRLTKSALIALAAAMLLPGAVGAQETLRVQTSFNAGDFSYQFVTGTAAPKLKEMTGGELEIEMLPTKAVVPHRDTPEAVAVGVLDGDFTASAYFSGREPAFALLGDLIAGYDEPKQMLDFCREGPGEDALQSAFDKIMPGKIQVIACGPYSRESLPSAVPIRTLVDMKGKKIRSPEGLAANVFARAGASPVSLPLSEVYTALEKGIVDAADSSAYVNNDAVGLHKIAKYPIYPGIHSMASLQFTLNKARYDALSEENKKALRDWWYQTMDEMRELAAAKDKELVDRDRAAGEIEIIDWSQEDRDAFREIAKEAWVAFAEKSPEAKKAYDAHISYMKSIGLLQ